MPLYKPSELLQFLESLNLRPKKGLSQNFLIDGNIIRKIIQVSHVEEGDIVLEIGPGPGSLTEALLQAKAHVIAVEKDNDLASALKRFKTEENQLDIYCEDVLEFDIKSTLAPLLKSNKKAKVIANLPYHITTPILATLVEMEELFSSITVMVQDEVARRFVAKPNTKDYSSFSLFLQFFSNPYYAFQVSKRCFFPAPKVQSAIVVLQLKTPPQVSSQQAFFIMTRTAFAQRRKMLRSSLDSLYDKNTVSEALESLHLRNDARPENLTLQNWLDLFEILHKLQK